MKTFRIYFRTCGAQDKRTAFDIIKASTAEEAVEIFTARHYWGTAIVAIFAD